MELAKYVYLKHETEKEERRKIRNSKEKVVKILNYCILAKPLFKIEDNVTKLLIISCLQAIILDKRDETVPYPIHRPKNRKREIRVQAALKSNEPYDFMRIYWVRKVANHFDANIGRCDIWQDIQFLESLCDIIMSKTLVNPNINDMLLVHSEFFLPLNDKFGQEHSKTTQKLVKHLYDKGFGYIDNGYMIRYIFFDSTNTDAEQRYNNLISQIDDTLKNKKQELSIIKPTINDVVEYKEWDSKLIFDYENYVCTLTGFYSPYIFTTNIPEESIKA